jgi:hypothetical protein
MVNVARILLDGIILSVIASLFVGATLRLNPRIWLRDYPKDIQAQVPPKTKAEKRLSLALGIPFLILFVAAPFVSTLSLKVRSHSDVSFLALWLHAFGVVFVFNVVDWLVLDWLMFCTLTPRFVVIPGTEGMAGYKDYAFHFRGFLIGTALSAGAGLAIAAIVSFL